jgi:hypothetical protein
MEPLARHHAPPLPGDQRSGILAAQERATRRDEQEHPSMRDA